VELENLAMGEAETKYDEKECLEIAVCHAQWGQS